MATRGRKPTPIELKLLTLAGETHPAAGRNATREDLSCILPGNSGVVLFWHIRRAPSEAMGFLVPIRFPSLRVVRARSA